MYLRTRPIYVASLSQYGILRPNWHCVPQVFQPNRGVEMSKKLVILTIAAAFVCVQAVPSLAARFPLTLISSPAHQFLNSTFVNVDSLRRAAREPECLLHPVDAASRGIDAGARVVIHNDRGAFTAIARVEETIRPGVVWAPSIWWGKFAADAANANQTTSQRETDLGHGPVFYDNLVQVRLAD